MKAKRGRPPLNRPRKDLGTPELIAKRAMLVKGADPALAEHPLGVLLARNMLDSDMKTARAMYDAAISFTGLWLQVYPKAFPISMLGQFVPGGSGVIPDDAELVLKDAMQHIETRQQLDAVINACIYHRMNPRTFKHLCAGLKRLTSWRRPMREAA